MLENYEWWQLLLFIIFSPLLVVAGLLSLKLLIVAALIALVAIAIAIVIVTAPIWIPVVVWANRDS